MAQSSNFPPCKVLLNIHHPEQPLKVMSALSNALETELINLLLRNTAYTPEASLFVGLFATDPGESGIVGELSGTDYARVEITNNSAAFTSVVTSTGMIRQNAAAITFPEAGAAWGTARYWAVYDSALGGTDNMLVRGTFSTAQVISLGDTPVIAAGAMQIYFVQGTSGLTLYAQQKLLERAFGSVAYTPPTLVYAAAGTGGNTTFTEWSDAGYARASMVFAAPSDGVCANSALVTVNSAVVSNTGPLTTFRLFDSATVGNALVGGVFPASRTVAVGNSAKFPIGSVQIGIA